MTTIRDVAGLARVSAATVSRVFARPEMVSADNRRRVMAAAEELGYTPSPVARSLARGRTGNLGLIVPDIETPFWAPLMKAVQRQARRQEYAAFIADSDEEASDEVRLARAMAKQVDGLVLASPHMSDDELRGVAELVPTVVMNRQPGVVPSVLATGADGMDQAVEHLAALAHQRVDYLCGPARSFSNEHRQASFRSACRRLGLQGSELGPFDGQWDSGVRAADRVIAGDATAAIAFNDQVALGLISQLTVRQVKVGSEISVVGFDDTWFAKLANPSLTSVRIPAAKAGSTAVRMLMDLIDDRPGAATAVTYLDSELIVRASSGPAIS